MQAMQKDEDHARQSAMASLDCLKEMVEELVKAEEADDNEAREKAEQIIHEDPLSLQIRSDWYSPGDKPEPGEYELLLGTGGPAVRIIGRLNGWSEPETATLQYQDWFTPWRDLSTTLEDDEVLMRYVRCFYFGE